MESASIRPRVSAPSLPAALRSPFFWLVSAVTVLAGALRLHALGSAHTDPYYDAAVRSMGLSLHNFFFGAYEPGGSVSIDKPPVDLWLQVATTKLLGFNARSLILPQALAATAAVPLLYDLVRRPFGRVAGVVAACALAVMPVSVLTSRSDTMDSLTMFLSVLAAWLVVLAAQRGRARWLYLAALVCGLNFEVKLFEALLALPALAVLYWLAMPAVARPRRAAHLGIAAVLFVTAALWWPVAVSLAPTSHTPYAIGSTNGSVWNALFVFNGTDRISPPQVHHRSHHRRVSIRRKLHLPVVHKRRPHRTPPGPVRLLERSRSRFGLLVGVELVGAIALGALALLLRRRGAAPDPLRRGFAWALGIWLIPGVVVYSAVHQVHPRYLEVLTPPIAATIGVGFATLLLAGARRRAAAAALMAGLAAVAVYVGWLELTGSAGEVVTLIAAGAAAVAIAFGPRRPALIAAGVLGVVALLASPTSRSFALVGNGDTDSGHPGTMPPGEVSQLSAYLARHAAGDRYELASASYSRAGPIIVRDGRPVIVETSIFGRPVTAIATLRAKVDSGQVRYALVGGVCGNPNQALIVHCPPIVRWTRAHSIDVSRAAGLHHRGVLFAFRRHA